MTSATVYDLATKDLDPPFAIVDLDAFDANGADLLRRAAGKPIRVVSKSVRCRYLLERVLARPGFEGLMCYSLAEAVWHVEQGTSEDIVVAYPTADHGALRRLAANDRARAAISIMVDSPEHLDLVDAALGQGHPEIRVCLELDASWRPLPGVHIGTRRSPVFSPRQAADLARTILSRKGFRLVGMMAYEGQIAGLGDAAGSGAKNSVIGWMQRKSIVEIAKRRAAAVRAVRALADLEFVNGGGSGSVESTGAEAAVTEIAAGSGLIGPTLFDGYAHFSPRPAAMFALPVVRRPAPKVATLFSGGYIASGPAESSRLPTPYLPEGLSLLGFEGAGEVQTPVSGEAARHLRLGDRVWLRHAKAGELAERFTHYHVVVGDRVDRTVPTYRGESQNFG
ncbi:amino acid deaminase/aldolase [Amycolatopsis keratiniphila]|uniref:Amino acid aldolase or racemase n=2 Tax=Amycolatopsis keratiniphila TaxID=129921 RepID=R4SG45_9PSEU|nr:amino acid deaminase/aldolase [Amycolatopsis keratiniphila]AGM02664.1 amino acid aldolase or racemase [Amycolatopsis keratiniphila]OLZ59828.1 alanine racemase [Amycolatopsis keratiniphila subsp. nogabecina]ONF62814.1 alanine racemase [Amycolatopsis keratiniphila subsp. keratiniphila]SDU55707.1 D-serine deaminase, pyridoxal phosphate-dependent [Amycolatopsis keratiniphila]